MLFYICYVQVGFLDELQLVQLYCASYNSYNPIVRVVTRTKLAVYNFYINFKPNLYITPE